MIPRPPAVLTFGEDGEDMFDRRVDDQALAYEESFTSVIITFPFCSSGCVARFGGRLEVVQRTTPHDVQVVAENRHALRIDAVDVLRA